MKGSRSSTSAEQAECGRVRGVASEEEGLLLQCEAVPFECGQEPGAEGVTCLQLLANGEGKLRGS